MSTSGEDLLAVCLTSDTCLLGIACVALSEDRRMWKRMDPLVCDAATVSLSLESIPGHVRSE